MMLAQFLFYPRWGLKVQEIERWVGESGSILFSSVLNMSHRKKMLT